MSGVEIAGLATELILGNSTDRLRAFLIETARLGMTDGKTAAMTVRKERILLLGADLVLLVHIRENPDRRLGEFLAASSKETHDEQRDQRINEKKVTHLNLRFKI